MRLTWGVGGVSLSKVGVYDKEGIVSPLHYYSDFDIDRFILMQFTGLHDKNGKEIYEGDIVQIYKHMSSEKSEVTQVVWDEENCEYKGIYPNIAVWEQHEVIGNIYENPELLEVTNTNGNP